jgi:hypothetical protein
VCDSTYVNGHRRNFFEKTFSALSRLDDAKEKFTITALLSDGSWIVFKKLADANRATIEKKGARSTPHALSLIAPEVEKKICLSTCGTNDNTNRFMRLSAPFAQFEPGQR